MLPTAQRLETVIEVSNNKHSNGIFYEVNLSVQDISTDIFRVLIFKLVQFEISYESNTRFSIRKTLFPEAQFS